MRDFDRWMRELPTKPAKPEPADILPEGVRKVANGYFITCCCCDNEFHSNYPDEMLADGGNYCGGSPRCCP